MERMTNNKRPPAHPTGPVRALKTTRQGMQLTMLWSNKGNRQVRCESSIEADYARFLEWDKDTVQYMEQPIEVSIRILGRAQPYVPDFWSLNTIGAQLITEIKPDHWAHSPKLVAKYKAAKDYFEQRGYRFKVITACDIRSSCLASNLRCLFPRLKESSPYQQMCVRDLLEKAGGQMTVGELLAQLGQDHLGAIFHHIYKYCKNIEKFQVGSQYPVCLAGGT